MIAGYRVSVKHKELAMIMDEYLMKARHEEILAEAERGRLVKLSKLKPDGAISSSVRFLVWFGGLLRMWGCRLEERFSVDVCVNQAQPVDRGLNV
jgi:hypothetical protein